MSMPKAAMYKESRPEFWKYQVWTSGQIPPVQLEAHSPGVKATP